MPLLGQREVQAHLSSLEDGVMGCRPLQQIDEQRRSAQPCTAEMPTSSAMWTCLDEARVAMACAARSLRMPVVRVGGKLRQKGAQGDSWSCRSIIVCSSMMSSLCRPRLLSAFP
jgi:hypothetical protein